MILLNRVLHTFSAIVLLNVVSTTFIFSQCNFSKAPAGDICASATYICGDKLDGYTGRLRQSISIDQPWLGMCNGNGSPDNMSWFSFTACSNKVTLEITVHSCYGYDTDKKINLGPNPNAGVQAGLYLKCDASKWLDCSKNPVNPPGLTGTFTVSSDKFIPGSLGYFYLDGFALSRDHVSVCEFSIRVIEGIDTSPVTPPDPNTLTKGQITGPNLISCSDMDHPQRYNLVEPERKVSFNNTCAPPSDFNPNDSICYLWNVSPAGGRYFQNQDSTGLYTDIVFTQPGTYTISANTMFNPFYVGSCANAAAGEIISWKVTVSHPDTIILPIISICPGHTSVFQGVVVDRDTTLYDTTDPCSVKLQLFKFERHKTNDMGVIIVCPNQSFRFQGIDFFKGNFDDVADVLDCALVHKFEVVEKVIDTLNIDTKYICQSDSFSFQGKSYGVGTFLIKDSSMCNIVHRLTVQQAQISIGINLDSDILTCQKKSILAKALTNTNAPGQVSIVWKNTSNAIIGQNSENTLVNPGTYIVTASYQSDVSTCSATTQFQIQSDLSLPKIMASVPSVQCINTNEKYPEIMVASSNPISNSEWTTPLGQKYNGFRVVADSANVVTGKPFQLKVIGQNGCVTDTSFLVPYNFTTADFQLKGDIINCYKAKDTILLTTNVIVDSIRWYKIQPTQAFYGSYPAKLFLEVDTPGIYKAEVMASASKCWSENQINIPEDTVKPEMILDNALKWYCNTSSVEISPQITTTGSLSYVWSTSDGKIASDISDKNLKAITVGTYTLNVQNKTNGCQKSGHINIIKEQNQPNEIEIETKDILCFGQNNGQAIIKSIKGGFEPYVITLNETKTGPENINLAKGDYTIEIKDKYECALKKSFTIFEPTLFNVETPLEVDIALAETTNLTFTSNYPDNEILTIVWKNSKGVILGNDFDLEFSSLHDETVSLEVTTVNGCKAQTRIKVNVENELKLFIPNIFSPNNDGVNDKLILFKNKIPITFNQYAIYDRYGNKVYYNQNNHFNDQNEGWDGTFNGKPVESGVYIMVLDYVDFLGSRQILKKDITVVR